MCFVLFAATVLVTAAEVGLVVGRRRPALGVLLAAVAGYCMVMGLSLPM
jgi:hypothetical protein